MQASILGRRRTAAAALSACTGPRFLPLLPLAWVGLVLCPFHNGPTAQLKYAEAGLSFGRFNLMQIHAGGECGLVACSGLQHWVWDYEQWVAHAGRAARLCLLCFLTHMRQCLRSRQRVDASADGLLGLMVLPQL